MSVDAEALAAIGRCDLAGRAWPRPEVASAHGGEGAGAGAGQAAHAAHMVGAPLTTVTPWLRDRLERRLRVEALDRAAPWRRRRARAPSTTFSPKMWKSGSTPKHDVARRLRAGPGGPGTCSRLASRLPWVSIAAFGRAGRAAGEDEHGEVVVGRDRRPAPGSAASRSSSATRARRARRRWLAITSRASGSGARSSAADGRLADGPDDHAPGADGGQLALELGRRARRVERHGHAARRRARRGTRPRSTSCWRR